jgi:toxin ParE1/3/4
MKLRFAPRAESDLADIYAYIARENPTAAERVRTAILDMTQIVTRRPYLGVQTGSSTLLRSVLVGRYQYRIHYSLMADELVILHIRHTARRPWSPDEPSDD